MFWLRLLGCFGRPFSDLQYLLALTSKMNTRIRMNAMAAILNEVAIATLRECLLLLVVLAVGDVDKRSIVVDVVVLAVGDVDKRSIVVDVVVLAVGDVDKRSDVVVELYANDVELLLHPEGCEPVINIDSATII